MRQKQQFIAYNIAEFKDKTLVWGNSFSHFTFFNNNNLTYPRAPFANIFALGSQQIVRFNRENDFEIVKSFHLHKQDWLVGYLGYDLKNQIENLTSSNEDLTGFPDIFFYQPKHIILIEDDTITIESFENPEQVYHEILSTNLHIDGTSSKSILGIHRGIDRKEYISTVERLRTHIEEGDIYEINFCMGFHSKVSKFNALATYKNLIDKSPTPFSVYQKIDQQYLMCASPERFLKKEGAKIITQPIKGTIKRGSSPEEDKSQAEKLRTSEKERAENMMIVDLVRNDLARSCKSGTVKVEEMFGIYPFKYLFQMISTVTGDLRDDIHFIDAIKNAFPMGSMTGAPKIKVMELIEQYEKNKRGLFSGAVGYITPQGDFDFNVVIRSIFYNAKTQQLSFQVGSAITYDSDPEQEYEECMLKVKAIKEALNIKEEQSGLKETSQ